MLKNWISKIFSKPARPVVYDHSFFKEGWFDNWEVLKKILFELIKTNGAWKNILDFGCGPGIMIDYMNDYGYNYFGCDYSEEARKLYLINYGKYPQKFINNLELCSDRKFDLFLAFDVFEHMTDNEIIELFQKIDHIPTLFINISREKRIPGHINLKKDRQWMKFFKKHGFKFLNTKTVEIRERYLKLRLGTPDLWDKNMFIFSKK